MNVLVTGAAGFLGRVVVADLLASGHSVRALVRHAAQCDDAPWRRSSQFALFAVDLRARAVALAPALRGVDAVVHLAASMSGDLHDQLATTVLGTENLLRAMVDARVRRLVLVSSLAVYDFHRMRSWSLLSEASPVEQPCTARDPYVAAKLLQERLSLEASARGELDITILRPGALYSPQKPWTARLGICPSPKFWITIGSLAAVPLVHVESCARAVTLALESSQAIGSTMNLVDDRPPSQWRYARRLRQFTQPRPRVLPLPLILLQVCALAAAVINRVMGIQLRWPQLLRSRSLAGRFKPLRYSNSLARKVLGWKPMGSAIEVLKTRTSANARAPVFANARPIEPHSSQQEVNSATGVLHR